MSQEPLQAIIGRIARFNQTNDPAHIVDPAAVGEADSLARDGVHDFNAMMALGMFHWYGYGVLPSGEDGADLAAALDNYGRVLGAIPPPLLLALLQRKASGSVPAQPEPAHFERLLVEAARTEDHETFGHGIEAMRRTIASLQDDDPAAAQFHYLLGRALRIRFKRTRDMNDLEDCITSLRAVLAAGPADDPERPDVQGALTSSLRDATHRPVSRVTSMRRLS